ncbi:TauD/TfdA family dioxygenase [Rhodoferax ferrireducens]|uniref:TauD/TfdA family dioxygenase n=1 Tax=Rhodoferax ferrireducens TaxID=192843 RepID=UPI003BB7D0E9
MLNTIKEEKPGIGWFEMPQFWAARLQSLLDVFDCYYGEESDPAWVGHHAKEPRFRLDVYDAAPELLQLSSELHELLGGRYCALFTRNFGLSAYSLPIQRKLLLCTSLALGSPTPTDQVSQRILWDVKARSTSKNHYATFSEHAAEAYYHTDTQYFSYPEKYIFLYTVCAAKCGGGVSSFLDARLVKNRLMASSEGSDAYKLLETEKLPFRIPSSFTSLGAAACAEFTFSPIFGDAPYIRFRKDTLEEGLRLRPEYDSPEVRWALELLERAIDSSTDTFSSPLPADSLSIVNNHVALHARTAFSDTSRHLIRARMQAI